MSVIKDLTVVAIQVAPYKVIKEGDLTSFEIQREGANAETEGYSVYTRMKSGEVACVHMSKYEASAVAEAKKFCKEFQVSIELFDWQVPYLSPGYEVDRLAKSFGIDVDTLAVSNISKATTEREMIAVDLGETAMGHDIAMEYGVPRKLFMPPTIASQQTSQHAWMETLRELVTQAYRNGYVMEIAPIDAIDLSSKKGWETYKMVGQIGIIGDDILPVPLSVSVTGIIKTSTYEFDGDEAVDFNKRFLGLHLPKVVQPLELSHEMLTDIRPDHPLDPLLAPTVAKAVMTTDGVRLQLNPVDHGVAGVTQAHVDLLAGINRELADSGQPVEFPGSLAAVEGVPALADHKRPVGVNINGFLDTGGGKRTAMYVGQSPNAIGTLVEEPSVAEDGMLLNDKDRQMTAEEAAALDGAGSSVTFEVFNANTATGMTPATAISTDAKTTNTSLPGAIIASAEPNAVQLKTSLQTGETTRVDETEHLLASPANASRLEESVKQMKEGRTVKFTFESRGDHSPSKE